MQDRPVVFVAPLIAMVPTLASLGGHAVLRADDTVCTGTLGAVTVDNLIVPQNRSCTLNATRVKGSIFVYTGATLSASAVRVVGDIQAEGASAVYVNPRSVIGGNVQIKQGRSARIDNATIDGDLQLEQNSRSLRVTRNNIGGNLQAFQNTGGVFISRNQIAENLQCKENEPPPTGGGNIAGDKEDQCTAL
jgi:hypothetical protein